ncbi:MAG: hypothetical protein AAGA91_14855 [Pseudomonadota bacterium]
MSEGPVHPEDILEEGANYKTIRGVRVRKGTIAAAVQNIAALERTSGEQREAVLDTLRQLAPALVVLDVHRYFACRNAEAEAILADAARQLDAPSNA